MAEGQGGKEARRNEQGCKSRTLRKGPEAWFIPLGVSKGGLGVEAPTGNGLVVIVLVSELNLHSSPLMIIHTMLALQYLVRLGL